MPSSEKPKRRVHLGDTGKHVSGMIRLLRVANRLSHTELAALMSNAGHKVSKTAISEIENGARRVSVDDLMAIAIALNAPPNKLLLPITEEEKYSFVTGSTHGVTNERLWRWALGQGSLDPSGKAAEAEEREREAVQRINSWQDRARLYQNRITRLENELRESRQQEYMSVGLASAPTGIRLPQQVETDIEDAERQLATAQRKLDEAELSLMRGHNDMDS